MPSRARPRADGPIVVVHSPRVVPHAAAIAMPEHELPPPPHPFANAHPDVHTTPASLPAPSARVPPRPRSTWLDQPLSILLGLVLSVGICISICNVPKLLSLLENPVRVLCNKVQIHEGINSTKPPYIHRLYFAPTAIDMFIPGYCHAYEDWQYAREFKDYASSTDVVVWPWPAPSSMPDLSVGIQLVQLEYGKIEYARLNQHSFAIFDERLWLDEKVEDVYRPDRTPPPTAENEFIMTLATGLFNSTTRLSAHLGSYYAQRATVVEQMSLLTRVTTRKHGSDKETATGTETHDALLTLYARLQDLQPVIETLLHEAGTFHNLLSQSIWFGRETATLVNADDVLRKAECEVRRNALRLYSVSCDIRRPVSLEELEAILVRHRDGVGRLRDELGRLWVLVREVLSSTDWSVEGVEMLVLKLQVGFALLE